MIRRVYLAIAAAMMTLALTAGPLMADEVERGKRIAERMCASCHVVGSEPAAGRTAPPFRQLANKILLNASYIDHRLRNPTPPMHRFHLSAPMVSDITAYLRSLELKVDQAVNGKRLAEGLCANCHVMGSEPAAGRTAPPFPQVANKVRLNEFLIGFWLRHPNPPMHSFQLSAPTVSDITAYLRSLKLKVDQAANGKRLAQQFCSNCHVVGSEPAAGRTAPPFAQLANKVRPNEFLIDYWLRNPTPPMHSFQLPGPTVSDIAAYLRSLKK